MAPGPELQIPQFDIRGCEVFGIHEAAAVQIMLFSAISRECIHDRLPQQKTDWAALTAHLPTNAYNASAVGSCTTAHRHVIFGHTCWCASTINAGRPASAAGWPD